MDDGTMETAVLRIGCKVNLTLRITGVRPNGWHELDTVFLPLDEPSDTLRLALRPGGGLALHCAEPGIDPVLFRTNSPFCWIDIRPISPQ